MGVSLQLIESGIDPLPARNSWEKAPPTSNLKNARSDIG